jgi:hypothetical protein
MPEIPEGAKVPTDHQPKAEARGDVITVEHNGTTYHIDRENADNLELMEFTEDGKYISAIRGYLGVDQWSAWKEANRDEKGRVRSADFESFLNAVMRAIGGESGNSSGSATS